MRSKKLMKRVLEGGFKSIMDGGDWNYDRFGFGEVDGKCYRVELEGYDDDRDVFELKEGLNVDGIIKEGVERKFFEVVEEDIFYDEELEGEMMDWLFSLDK
jgi:hypothetical protein